MECAVVSSEGQLVIPREIMHEMGIVNGGKVYFIKKNGTLVIKPSDYDPLSSLQDLMEGEAERVGWKTEEDVINYCKEIRREIALEVKNNPV